MCKLDSSLIGIIPSNGAPSIETVTAFSSTCSATPFTISPS